MAECGDQTVRALPLFAKRAFVTALAAAMTATILMGGTVPQAKADIVTHYFETGRDFTGLAVNATTNQAYVLNDAHENITVHDGSEHRTELVGVPGRPLAMTLNATTNTVYVSTILGFFAMDGFTKAISPRKGDGGVALAANERTNRIYTQQDGTITEHDVATNTARTIETGLYATKLAVNALTNKVYSPGVDGTISVIDGNTHSVSTVQAGMDIGAIAINEKTNKVYVTNPGSNTISVMDGTTHAVKTIQVGSDPQSLVVNRTSNQIYVLNSGSSSMTVIDGTTNQTRNVQLDTGSHALAVNEATNKIYVATPTTLRVVRADSLSSGLVTMNGTPAGVAVNEKTNEIYVAHYWGSANVIDGRDIPPKFTSDPPRSTGTEGTWYRHQFTASGSLTPTFRIASGLLPPGLTMSEAGVLSGIPTSPGRFSFTVGATNGILPDGAAPVTLTIAPSEVRHDFNSDGKPDVLARDAAGDLYLYPGTGTGGWQSRIKVGQGWNVMTAVMAPGDFNGDHKSDVLARDAQGFMWLYPGTGTGGWASPVKVGDGWNIMTAITGIGDLDRDGNNDVVARATSGHLWHYGGNGNGGWLNPYHIGGGWNEMTAMTDPGDFDRDGVQDLLARDRNGVLWLYSGDHSHASFYNGMPIGWGWNAMTAIAGPGDFNGDRNVDLLARDSAGVLWLYPGDGINSWLPRVQVGTGWNVMNAIF